MVVAPRAGAWIETCPAGTIAKRSKVAPRAGAWIETFCLLNVCRRVMVAPRAGAWIETSPIQERPYAASSRPVRARGLKPHKEGLVIGSGWSRPVRARGLKLAKEARKSAESGRAPCGRVD